MLGLSVAMAIACVLTVYVGATVQASIGHSWHSPTDSWLETCRSLRVSSCYGSRTVLNSCVHWTTKTCLLTR